MAFHPIGREPAEAITNFPPAPRTNRCRVEEAGRVPQKRAHQPLTDDETHFITVDLEIYSKRRLTPLVDAFGRKVVVLHEGRWGSGYGAFVELGSSWNKSADQEIRGLISLIRALPGPARRLWNAAQRREFNVGIQAAEKSRLFELRLPTKSIEAVASVGGRIVITVYAPTRQA